MREGKIKLKIGKGKPFLVDIFNHTEFLDYAISNRKLSYSQFNEMRRSYNYYDTILCENNFNIELKCIVYTAFTYDKKHLLGKSQTATKAIYEFIINQFENE